jgi:galactokinase
MNEVIAYAPGRVELLGNHTDYNEGWVLSAAIGRGVQARGTRIDGTTLEITSELLGREVRASLDDLAPVDGDNGWANYPLGVAWTFRKAGFDIGGFKLSLASDVPLGAGLSSSAALEVATGTFLKKLFDLAIEPMALAKLCRRAENEFVGVNCGLLDQASSVFGRANHAVYLDCRNETVETAPFPPGVALLVSHSGVKHSLVGGEYNERRTQCFEAARVLGVRALRDATRAQLEASRSEMPEISFRRALHIVGENERVLRGVDALRQGHVEEFGALMFDSHESSRLNFENSTPELDTLVEIARSESGVLGSRLTGGGFGGATVSLVRSENADAIQQNIRQRYFDATGHRAETWLCAIADGAR